MRAVFQWLAGMVAALAVLLVFRLVFGVELSAAEGLAVGSAIIAVLIIEEIFAPESSDDE